MPSLWWMALLALRISKVAFDIFVQTILIQDPAHANSFIFPAMASTRRVSFLSLMCINVLNLEGLN
jgi:hypothetical protein